MSDISIFYPTFRINSKRPEEDCAIAQVRATHGRVQILSINAGHDERHATERVADGDFAASCASRDQARIPIAGRKGEITENYGDSARNNPDPGRRE
jgi:hypothetical protein